MKRASSTAPGLPVTGTDGSTIAHLWIEMREIMGRSQGPPVKPSPAVRPIEPLIRELAPKVLGAVVRRFRDLTKHVASSCLLDVLPHVGWKKEPLFFQLLGCLRHCGDVSVVIHVALFKGEARIARGQPVRFGDLECDVLAACFTTLVLAEAVATQRQARRCHECLCAAANLP